MSSLNIGVIGKIKSVAVINFVTYDKTLFLPQEYLNIIIGPNGTGKSTIVSAIVLGMGGNCKVLSRSSNIEDFIKNGKEEAKIEVKIYKDNDRGILTLNRTFNKEGNQTFGIDGKKITQRDYLKRVADFNIQIDNLCQFLPQDRVQDFAKMNPQEILTNTQNSVCSKDILDTFTKLTDLQNTDKNSDKEYTENLAKLNEAQKRNEGIKAIIETMREKDNLVAKVDVCKMKKAWLAYDTFAEKCKLAEADLEASKQALNMKERKLQPLEEKVKNISKNTTELQGRVNLETKKFEKISQNLITSTENSEKYEDLIFKSKSEYQELLILVRDKEKEIDTNRKYLAALVKDIETAKQNEIPDVDRQIDVCTEKFNKIKSATAVLMDKRNNINLELDDSIKPQIVAHQRRIAAMENIREMRLNILKQRFPDVYTATMWLKDNRNMFDGVIYDPVMMEINVKDRKNAKYIESIVAVKDLTCFICENTEDVDRLKNELCIKKKLKISIAESKASTTVCRSEQPIENLRKYGFQNYVIDQIEGPIPVLNQLCSLYRIHNVPVGNDYTYNNTNLIPNSLRLYFSTNHRIAVTVSKYSNNSSTMTSLIHAKDLLGISIDQSELNNEKKSLEKIVRKSDTLKNARTQIEGEIKNNEVASNDVATTKKDLLNNKKAKEEIFVKATRCKDKITMLTNSLVDTTTAKAKFTETTQNIVKKLITLKGQMIDQIDEYQKNVLCLALHKEKLTMFNRNNNDLLNEKRAIEEEVRVAKGLYERVVQILRKCEIERSAKQQEALHLSKNRNPKDKNFPFKAEFASIPSALNELDEYIHEIQARISCMTGGQENIEREYNDRLKYIADLKVLVANNSTDKDKVRSDIKRFHAIWYPEISKIVDIINTNFSKFMSSMGFAGEVQITRKDEHDYSQYGIQIQVKYRSQEKLQALDRYIQSGGERAVAIAVYTLSLQHITNVPFRCVDEINQGMDQRNERKVFEMLVRETCQTGNSQYFFVTPKLLPNLISNEKMSVHIVKNGKNVEHAYMFLNNY